MSKYDYSSLEEKEKELEKLKAMLASDEKNRKQMEKEKEAHLQRIAQLQKENEALNRRLQQYMDLLDQKERTMLATENELNYYKSQGTIGFEIKKLLGKRETH